MCARLKTAVAGLAVRCLRGGARIALAGDGSYTCRMIDADVAIIGAGPIGIELAVGLKRAGLSYLHFEAGQVGQTVSWYPKQVKFFSSPERIAIAGVPLNTADQNKATREEYLAYLRGVVQQFELPIHTYERVEDIDVHEDHTFTLHTRRGDDRCSYTVNHVVLAVGDMHHPRMLHIPGEDRPNVSHYFEDPHMYFMKRLLIVGGKNSAVEAALRCHRVGAHVSISYRGDSFDERAIKYWLLPELQSLIADSKIAFYPRTTPTRIDDREVRLERLDGGDPIDVPADFVLLLTGYRMDTRLYEQAGLELAGANQAPVLDEATQESSVPGIYVAGTAAAGTQVRFRLFIENCHVHVARILAALTGDAEKARTLTARQYVLPES